MMCERERASAPRTRERYIIVIAAHISEIPGWFHKLQAVKGTRKVVYNRRRRPPARTRPPPLAPRLFTIRLSRAFTRL